jgi:hypothetical protein
MRHEMTFRYIGFAAIALLVIGLAGWYFFISRQTANLGEIGEARGFAVGVPSFTGSRGSTSENIASGFADAPPEEEAEPQRPPRLWRVSTSPVAGAGFVSVASTSVLRYVERSTGHVFDVDPMTGIVTRRTNRLIPKVYEASVGKGDTIVARTITDEGERETFVGSLGTTTEEGFTPLTGVDLGPSIRDIAFADDGVVFLAETAAGGAQLVRANIDGSEPSILRAFGAGDFNLSLLGDDRIILIEKPSSGMPGYAYAVGNGLVSLARAVPGLTLAARTGSSTAVLIGADDGSDLSLSVRPTLDSASLTLDIDTVADKCVWMPGISFTAYCAVPEERPAPGFLTNWHRGLVHTSDSWHIVDGSAGTSDSFFQMRSDDAIDVEKPTTDGGGNFIAFMNARDKSLWLLRIVE